MFNGFGNFVRNLGAFMLQDNVSFHHNNTAMVEVRDNGTSRLFNFGEPFRKMN